MTTLSAFVKKVVSGVLWVLTLPLANLWLPFLLIFLTASVTDIATVILNDTGHADLIIDESFLLFFYLLFLSVLALILTIYHSVLNLIKKVVVSAF
jgi:hypothetical protein